MEQLKQMEQLNDHSHSNFVVNPNLKIVASDLLGILYLGFKQVYIVLCSCMCVVLFSYLTFVEEFCLSACLFLCCHIMVAAIMKNPILIRNITITGIINAHMKCVLGLKKHLKNEARQELSTCYPAYGTAKVCQKISIISLYSS